MPWSITSPLAFLGGPADWVIIFVVALIIFGPKKLPEVGQQLAKALREFRKIADEVTGATKSIHDEISRCRRSDTEPCRVDRPTRRPLIQTLASRYLRSRSGNKLCLRLSEDPMASGSASQRRAWKPRNRPVCGLSTDPGSKTE